MKSGETGRSAAKRVFLDLSQVSRSAGDVLGRVKFRDSGDSEDAGVAVGKSKDATIGLLTVFMGIEGEGELGSLPAGQRKELQAGAKRVVKAAVLVEKALQGPFSTAGDRDDALLASKDLQKSRKRFMQEFSLEDDGEGPARPEEAGKPAGAKKSAEPAEEDEDEGDEAAE